MVDCVHSWTARTEVPLTRLLQWLGVPSGTFYKWKQRYGKPSEHNGWMPRDHWLAGWERDAILDFYREHPLKSYRVLAAMMHEAGIVTASASSVYRVLKKAGLMDQRRTCTRRKGRACEQPDRPRTTGTPMPSLASV